jgi:hypothetical protein
MGAIGSSHSDGWEFLPPTFAADSPSCPCLSVPVVQFLSVLPGVRAFPSVRRAPA